MGETACTLEPDSNGQTPGRQPREAQVAAEDRTKAVTDRGPSASAQEGVPKCDRLTSQANTDTHMPVQVRHELHKVREKAREAADDQKFAVQRTIAGFHQQQNSSSQEFQKCQALRVVKDRELSSLRDQQAVQQQRAREQRAELEAEYEAKLAPMREGARLCTALPCLSLPSALSAPSFLVPLVLQKTGGLRWPLVSDALRLCRVAKRAWLGSHGAKLNYAGAVALSRQHGRDPLQAAIRQVHQTLL